MTSFYPEEMTNPMRTYLSNIGVKELKNHKEVEKVFSENEGTTFLIINSVCGCAAANARPGIKLAIQNEKLPKNIVTVFAGVDNEATQKAREYIKDYEPSSPFFGLFKDGKLIFVNQRKDLVYKSPEQISNELKNVFNKHC